jgi:hypothetical protein
MSKHSLLLILAICSAAMTTNSYADLTTPVPPNHYHCIGKNVDLVLRTDAFNKTTMKLTLDGIEHKAHNTDIVSESTNIGYLKEIMIKFSPDSSITKAEVIIPYIYLGITKNHESFKSQLIITNFIRPTINGFPEGNTTNSKRYVHLFCKARLIN